MSRTWITYRRFPVEQDLSEVHAFLSSQGIAHIFTEEGGEQVLWLTSHDDAAYVENFLEKYFNGEVELRRRASHDILKRPGIVEFASASPVTSFIVLLGFFGYLIGDVIASSAIFKHLAYLPYPYLIKNFEFWRLVTPAFVHFSVAHYLMNAVWICILGRILENYLGKRPYLYLVLVTAICGNVAQFNASYSNLFGGLSGVVYGLLGFLAMAKFGFRENRLEIPMAVIVVCLISMALGFLGALDWMSSGGIANWAHLGGFMSGATFALAYFLRKRQKNEL